MKRLIYTFAFILLGANYCFAQFTLNATVPAAADVCYAYGNFNSWVAGTTQMTYVSTTGSTKLFTLNLPLTFVNSGTFKILAGPYTGNEQTDTQFSAVATGTSQNVTVTAFNSIQYYLTVNVTVPLAVNECWGIGQWGWTLPDNAKQLFLKSTDATTKVFSNTFMSNSTHSFSGKFLSGLNGSSWTYQQTQGANFTNPGTGNTVNFTVSAFNAIYIPAGINVSHGTHTAYSYVYGAGPSPSQSFIVSGGSMTEGITITPSSNFEISTNNTTFSSTAIVIGSVGTIASTTVYIRLKSGLPVGSYTSEQITLSSTGNTSKYVACSGSVTAASAINTGGNISSLGISPQNLANTILTVSSGELVVDQPTTVHSIVVNPGAKLTLNNSIALSATNGITLQNTASGTASFVDSRTTDSPASIAGTVQQAITETNRNWYVGIPVSGKSATDITLSGAKIVKRNEGASTWDDVTGLLTAGVGYIAVASANSGTTTWSLNGNLNSGKVEVPVTRSGVSSMGFNLLGNPYPSYLNWEQVLNLDASNASLLQPSIWYRTASYNSGTGKFDYTFNTYNSTGRISTPSTTTGYIPPMQAFWVRANNAGTVTFTNAMRSHGDGVTNKLKAPRANTQKIIRLQVSNSTNNTDETVLYFDENAQNSFDSYDSQKMSTNSPSIPEIYSIAGTEQLVINGMNSITLNQEIPLGFTTGQSNEFSIKANEISNFDSGTQIVLNDNQTNTQWNLSDGSAYNFSSDITTSNTSRFSIVFKATSISTGNGPHNYDLNSILIYRNANNLITVNCVNGIVGQATATVYNAIGQKLVEKNLKSSITVLDNSFNAGVYLVSVLVNGKCITQKVVVN